MTLKLSAVFSFANCKSLQNKGFILFFNNKASICEDIHTHICPRKSLLECLYQVSQSLLGHMPNNLVSVKGLPYKYQKDLFLKAVKWSQAWILGTKQSVSLSLHRIQIHVQPHTVKFLSRIYFQVECINKNMKCIFLYKS